MIEPFGALPDGTPVEMLTLANANGVEVKAITYGCIIVALRTPDRRGRSGDVALGFDRLESYVESSPYFGAVIGRYANRIAEARFTLDGRTYLLAANEQAHGNHLHGGIRGFDKHVWKVDQSTGASSVSFRRISPEGEEGYPGRLDARVTYTLGGGNELQIDYFAATDAPTHVNLTQHTYFNLRGEGDGDILDHRLEIAAAHYLPVDERLIPTGRIAPVEATPFDFTTSRTIGEHIESSDLQIARGGGYDHNYVLDRPNGPEYAARLSDPSSGRTLEVFTTEPGLQFYSGNVLDGSLAGKARRRYVPRGALCLEPQHYPDSPNRPQFPSTVVRPGHPYRSRTIYRFSAK